MGRKWAILWHATFSLIAGVLYFLCVLPRWSELMGETSRALGMAGRITSGALIGLAALPVVFTLLRTRKPELGTPQLALSIWLWSIVAHVLAGVLIIGTAISEIWLSLDTVGQWLFGIYGAAAAIAVLGIFGFYLAFAAELPPPPPKPIKLKEPKQKRKGRKKRGKGEDTESEADETDEAAEITESEADEITESEAVEAGEAETAEVKLSESETQVGATAEKAAESADATVESPLVTTEIPKPEPAAEAPTQEAPVAEAGDNTEVIEVADKPRPRLQNRRPTGKTTQRRRRTRGGVAVED